MLLMWKVHYWDRALRETRERNLWLDTASLEPALQSAVEYIAESGRASSGREIMQFRHLFIDDQGGNGPGDMRRFGKIVPVGPDQYFEDETGAELLLREMGPLVTGSPTAVMLPPGTQPRDEEFFLAGPEPMAMDGVALTDDEIGLLAYFCRDLQELQASPFRQNSPGSFSVTDSTVTTAASDAEIRSFVTIYRRLFMAEEPANLEKAVAIFLKYQGTNRYGKLVASFADEYRHDMKAPVSVFPMMRGAKVTFTQKRLIKAFLYTQYAHQPLSGNLKDYATCLRQVNGNPDFLFWLFLSEIWGSSLTLTNAGNIIADWFREYCRRKNIKPEILNSVGVAHPGLGADEKSSDRRARVIREQTNSLADKLWRQDGCPECGPAAFLETAREQLGRLVSL